MNSNRLAAIVAALALVVSAAAVPGLAAADEHVEVTVEQQPATGDAVVTVTEDGDAVENASVIVDADNYSGTGGYETDENGTVTLPNPDERVNVTLSVNVSGDVRTVEAELVPRADSLAIDVEDADEDNATVTVTQYGEEVEGANVTVEGDAYADNGTYETDEDGEFELPAPEEPTEVTMNASYDGLTAERTVTLGENELELEVEQEDDGVTVEVTRNDTGVEGANVTVEAAEGESYVDEGEYETDENGTVGLSAPEETVNVTVTATDGDDTVTENVTLENETTEFRTFGGKISAFVHQLLSGATGPGIGGEVSEFARENNPGKADENAGNGNGNGNAEDVEKGPPEDVPGKADEMRGDDEGDENETAEDDEEEIEENEENEEGADEEEEEEKEDEEDADEDDEEEQEDGGNGPPAHANN